MAEKQTVIIPKGLISPGQDAVIEIPANLQGPGTVVAKLKGSPGSSRSMRSPGSPSTPPQQQQSYVRKPTDRKMPRSFNQRQYWDEFDPSFTSSPQGEEDSEGSVIYRDFRPRFTGTYERSGSPAAEYLSPETSRMRSFELGNLSPPPPQPSQSMSSSSHPGYYSDSYTSGSGSGGRYSSSAILSSLGGIERKEMSMIVGDLSGYQNARRKLIFDTSSLQSASDISGDFLRRTV